jgi:membrane protein required for beta-lactamase induction
MSLEFLFGAIYAFAAAVMLWSLTQLNRFLAETRDIGDEGCLERFKALARVQMYLALVGAVFLTAGMLAGIAVIARHGLLGLLVVILTNMLILGLGMYHKKVEARTRSLQAASDALAKEYRRISGTWVKKALPDF